MSSGVELPLVPSARSSASAASLSGRRSVHSAGSTASYTSTKSLKKSCEGESEDGEDDGEDGEELEEPHETSDESHTSAGGIWDQVESFLSKPSPSFTALAKAGSSKSVTAAPTTTHTLPTLKSGTGERKHPVAPSLGGGNQARASRPSRILTTQGTVSSKSFDPKLLQEAFAYAEKIQKVNFDADDDDDELDQQREAERRARVGTLRRDGSSGGVGGLSAAVGGPQQGSFRHEKSDSSANVKKKKSTTSGATKGSAYGAPVKPQPAKKKPAADRRPTKEPTDWDATPSSADPSGETMSRKGSSSAAMMDQQTIQALVSNFQNGTTLDELRKELVASQQSMAFSRQVIQEAAKSFFHARK